VATSTLGKSIKKNVVNESSPSYFPLLDPASWLFDEISITQPTRAAELENAGPPAALVGAIGVSFEKALKCKGIRWGLEESGSTPKDYRAVVQFNVGTSTFDWFFNARSGYRAHFRLRPDSGLEFNQQILQALTTTMNLNLHDVIIGRRLSADFNDEGEVSIQKRFLMTSLAPHISKIWFSTRLIGESGVMQNLSVALTGPKILLNGAESWAAPFPVDDHAWIEMKGAFVGKEGLYPSKDPKVRAQQLHKTGAV
jgi:hypothetical protein